MARESGETYDGSGWQEWLGRHGPALLLFARQWTANAADAEDAVQEGFVRFWRARQRARDAGYLYACVRSAAIDLSRSRRRRRATDSGRTTAGSAALVATAPGGAPDRAEQAELAAAIEVSLGRLPPEQREVVVMKIWGGLTFAEIAKAAGVSLNTAASRYRYGLGRLEADLADLSGVSQLPEEVSRE